jgi:subtilisin family serine protease
MAVLRIGIVDTGLNPWHSHVRGSVTGCRIFLGADGSVAEDGDFRDVIGHGTAVAGVIREAFPEAEIFAVRVFDAEEVTYPTLVARGILRAAAEQCDYVNLSISVPPGPVTKPQRRVCGGHRSGHRPGSLGTAGPSRLAAGFGAGCLRCYCGRRARVR